MERLDMKLLAIALVACLALPGAVAAQSPIHTSIDRAVAQQAAPPGRQHWDLYWSGIALVSLGGGMLAWGIDMRDQTATCPSSGPGSVSCTNNHRGLWIGGGVAIAGAGVALAAIGRKRVRALPTVEFKPSGLALTQRVTF